MPNKNRKVKKMKKKNYIVIIIGLMIVGGVSISVGFSCSNDGPQEIVEPKPETLNGQWGNICRTADSSYQSASYEFTGLNMVREQTEFSDSFCRNPKFTMHFTGSYILGVSSPTITGARNIDFTVNTFTITPRSQVQVDEFNGGSAAGYTDWKLDEAKNVLGKTIGAGANAFVINSSEKVYEIIRLTSKTLLMGSMDHCVGMCTEVANRPTLLDNRDIYFIDDASPTTELEGMWSTPCLDTGGSGEISGQIYKNNLVARTQIVFDDVSCTTKKASLTYTGFYSLPGAQGDNQKINFVIASFSITLHTDQQVTENNNNSFAGYTNWEKNKTKNLLGKSIPMGSGNFTFESNQIIYQIYKISGSTKQLGEESACDGPCVAEENRPTTLSTITFDKLP